MTYFTESYAYMHGTANITGHKLSYVLCLVHRKARSWKSLPTNYFWLSSVKLFYICKYAGVDFFNAEEKNFFLFFTTFF